MAIKTDDVISGKRGMNPHRERNIGSLWVHGLSYSKMTEKWGGRDHHQMSIIRTRSPSYRGVH